MTSCNVTGANRTQTQPHYNDYTQHIGHRKGYRPGTLTITKNKLSAKQLKKERTIFATKNKQKHQMCDCYTVWLLFRHSTDNNGQ